MKNLYIDCGMGAAGDMLTAALYDLLSDEEKKTFLDIIDNLGLHGVSFEISQSVKCGITGSHVTVKINGEEEISEDYSDHHDHRYNHDNHYHDANHNHHNSHHHTSFSEICNIIDSFNLSSKVKEDVKEIYMIIAEAESKVHGVEVSQIHFHEVGSLDAIVDITASSVLFEMIGADRVYASPIHVGSGKVRCAHGIMPVPAPATAEILKGIPIYSGQINGELCTPTGAAILKYYVDDFKAMPVMTAEKIGYGMGNKDFEAANCVRIFLSNSGNNEDTVINLNFNVDDMTGEEIGFAIDILMENGARDVFSVPVTMKKSRPGQLITVLCTPSDKDKMVGLIMKHTTTIGIRETVCQRNILNRKIKTVETEFGTVKVKNCEGYGTAKSKIEFDDLARIAKEKNMSLYEVRAMLKDM